MWLTNAAGNATSAAAAHASVVVSPSGPGGSGTGTGHSAGTKPTIRITEALRGRELVVHVSGPASGRVRVGFTGRLGGRTVASAARTVALKRGRLTVVFKPGPRTAALALIRVSAKLDHELAVTSTLRRSTSRHSKPKQ